MENNVIKTKTFIKLDFIDRIKVLFGRTIKVTIDITTIEEVTHCCTTSKVSILNGGIQKHGKNKPDFGYVISEI